MASCPPPKPSPCRRCYRVKVSSSPLSAQQFLKRGDSSRKRKSPVEWTPSKRARWNNLPDTILVEVLKWIPQNELGVCAQISRQWYRVVYSTGVWEDREILFDFSAFCSIEYNGKCEQYEWFVEKMGRYVRNAKLVLNLVCSRLRDPRFRGAACRRQQYEVMERLFEGGRLRSLQIDFVPQFNPPHVYMGYCAHQDCTDPVQNFLKKISSDLPGLRRLSVQCLPDWHWELLLRTIPKMTNLEKLEMNHKKHQPFRIVLYMGDVHGMIPAALSNMSTLRVLKLANVDVQDTLWHALANHSGIPLQQLTMVAYTDFNPFSLPTWERVAQKFPGLSVELFFRHGQQRLVLRKSEFESFLRDDVRLKTLCVSQAKLCREIAMIDVLQIVAEKYTDSLETFLFFQSRGQPMVASKEVELIRRFPKLAEVAIAPVITDKRLKQLAKGCRGQLRELLVRSVLKYMPDANKLVKMEAKEVSNLETVVTRLLGYPWEMSAPSWAERELNAESDIEFAEACMEQYM
ncbi:uncharacterized protein LOC144920473 [Branchiostoma floridae x Branchiostoma belcheri]